MVVVWPVIEQWRLISLSSVTSDSTVTPSSVEVATGRAVRCVPAAGNTPGRDWRLLPVDIVRAVRAGVVMVVVDYNVEVYVMVYNVVRLAFGGCVIEPRFPARFCVFKSFKP
jgi:hypothetical protein